MNTSNQNTALFDILFGEKHSLLVYTVAQLRE